MYIIQFIIELRINNLLGLCTYWFTIWYKVQLSEIYEVSNNKSSSCNLSGLRKGILGDGRHDLHRAVHTVSHKLLLLLQSHSWDEFIHLSGYQLPVSLKPQLKKRTNIYLLVCDFGLVQADCQVAIICCLISHMDWFIWRPWWPPCLEPCHHSPRAVNRGCEPWMVAVHLVWTFSCRSVCTWREWCRK